MLEESTDNLIETNVTNWKVKLLGISFSFLQALFLLITNTLVKKMGLNYGDVLFMRSTVQIFLAFVLIIKTGRSMWIWEVDDGKSVNQVRTLLIFSGIISGILNLSDLIAITYMPLGDAMTIILSGVLPTMIISRIFLKERLKLYKIVCAVLIISGIILITRPPFLYKGTRINVLNTSNFDSNSFDYTLETVSHKSRYYYFGVLSALICTLCSGTIRVVMKILSQNKSTSSIELPLLYGSSGCLIVALILPAFGGNQRILFPASQPGQYGTWQWFSLIMIVLMGIANWFLRFEGIKLIGPVIFGFIRTTEIIVAYLIQTTFFNTVPHISSLIGSGCIVIACIATLLEDKFLQILHPKFRNVF